MIIDIEIFNPYYWMFNLGLSLNRYEQNDGKYQWVLKEFVIGLLVINIKFSIKKHVTKMGAN
jgi:hypothetical protein